MKTRRESAISPLALLLLAAMLSLPFVLYLTWGHDAPDPVQYKTHTVPSVPGIGGPTIGMTVEPSGYGTVTKAPIELVPMDEPAEPMASPPEASIARDVASFIRGLPDLKVTGGPKPGPDGTILCTSEAPPVWRGRIELVDGCLLLRDERMVEPVSLVMLPAPAIFRAKDGYLSVASMPYGRQDTLRVGEPEGVFTGQGCSRPNFLPAPPQLAKACGVERVVNLSRIERRPVCSEAELARLARLRQQHAQTAFRIRAQHDRCVAGGTAPANCPPPVIPQPIELYEPGCRLP